MDLIGNNATDIALLANVLAGHLDGLLVDLFENDLTPDRDTQLGEFTVATYTGYAQAEVTWGTPSIADDGTVEVIGTIPEFRPTATSAGKQIYGAYFTDAVGGALRFSGRSDNAPVNMALTTDVYLITVRYRPNGGSYIVEIS